MIFKVIPQNETRLRVQNAKTTRRGTCGGRRWSLGADHRDALSRYAEQVKFSAPPMGT